MTETFEVGQKVKVFSDKGGEIVCGPVRSTFGGYTGYVVRVDGVDVWHKSGDLSAIPAPPKFAVGDKVTHQTFGSGEIAFGPFEHYSGPSRYLMKQEDGKHALCEGDALEAFSPEPIKVGDRVRVVRDDQTMKAGEFIGRTGTVTTVCDDGRALPYRVRLDDPSGTWDEASWWVEEVEHANEPAADTYEHDGVTYDLTARYRDRDGDYWTFKRVDGEVRGAYATSNVDRSASITDYSDTLTDTVREFGPLTRVND